MHQTRPTLGSSSEDSPADFPLEELQKHRGRWVAFSADGRRLVASGVTLAEVDALVRVAGENPEEVLLERVSDGGYILSGSELT